jgi:hypothetical protein
MTRAAAALERGYRRWLLWYPREFRREHEAEMITVLLASARDGQCRPCPRECLDLLCSALGMRLRPRVPRSERSTFAAIRLMYVGALVELASAIVVLASMGDVRSAVVARNPGYTASQWRTEVADSLVPLAVAALLAVGLWLWLAWAIGRRHRWARMAVALFFGLNTYGLLNGLAHGSALYARADLAAAGVLWLVHATTVVLLFHKPLRTIAAVRPAAPRTGAD